MRDTVVTDHSENKKSLMGSCMLKTLFCGAPLFSTPSTPSSRTSTNFYEAPPPPYSESSDQNVFQTQPTSVNSTELRGTMSFDLIEELVSNIRDMNSAYA
ncbi:unnamed protein product [Anisakis simplex]|uniref:Transcription repressor n=1 Tax=Anisakis simplex TaxID=6269 RepID=A0A0M3JZA5_ANISI|nr:unnamed protein product [Anisakis simplex]